MLAHSWVVTLALFVYILFVSSQPLAAPPPAIRARDTVNIFSSKVVEGAGGRMAKRCLYIVCTVSRVENSSFSRLCVCVQAYFVKPPFYEIRSCELRKVKKKTSEPVVVSTPFFLAELDRDFGGKKIRVRCA